jgi:hypothetical protein
MEAASVLGRNRHVNAAPASLPDELAESLAQVLEALASTAVPWVLTGSTAFALQGVEGIGSPTDIDLQSDRAGAFTVEARLLEIGAEPVRPVRFSAKKQVRSYFGILRLGRVPIELMGDVETRDIDGNWNGPPHLATHRCCVDWERWRVPVLDLHYEALAYHRLGRHDRATAIQRTAAKRERLWNERN